jgi:ABC-2 type transport system ATP-binding protein
VLEQVGLKESMNKRFRKYSLGMKQRLGIAAAVMENPDIVLLDEPTNALDESGINMLHEILQEHKKRGALIVMASHDAVFLEQEADTVYWLENGSIREGILQ